jgi:hypothetical protein
MPGLKKLYEEICQGVPASTATRPETIAVCNGAAR